MPNINQTIINTIISDLPHVIAIYLFGSYGTKYETTESDVDIAVLCKEEIDSQHLWQLSQKIAILLQRDIDLIDLKQASTVFSFQITYYGKRIYCDSTAHCDLFETHIFSDYVRLNEARRGIIRDIQQRGYIFHGRRDIK